MTLPDIETVSALVHQAWMDAKRAQGVQSRLSETGEELMQPYAQLSERAKALDRDTVRAVYAAIERGEADAAAHAAAGAAAAAAEPGDSASQAAAPVPLLGLRSAIYPVADLAAAKAWYSRLLSAEPYFDQPFYVGFEVGGFELGLLPGGTPATTGAQPLWGVADADQALARCLALGAKPLDAVQDVGDGIRVAAVVDPFGNRLGLIENPTFRLDKLR